MLGKFKWSQGLCWVSNFLTFDINIAWIASLSVLLSSFKTADLMHKILPHFVFFHETPFDNLRFSFCAFEHTNWLSAGADWQTSNKSRSNSLQYFADLSNCILACASGQWLRDVLVTVICEFVEQQLAINSGIVFNHNTPAVRWMTNRCASSFSYFDVKSSSCSYCKRKWDNRCVVEL